MFLKIGVNELDLIPAPLAVIRAVFTPYVFSGFVCYGISSLLYLVALSELDLSYAYPFVALSFVMVTLASWYFLDETLPLLRVAGLVLIMSGVLTVAVSYQHEPPEVPLIERPAEPDV